MCNGGDLEHPTVPQQKPLSNPHRPGLGGQKLEIHRIERNEAMIEKIALLEQHFWKYVETDTPPPADSSDSAGQSLRW